MAYFKEAYQRPSRVSALLHSACIVYNKLYLDLSMPKILVLSNLSLSLSLSVNCGLHQKGLMRGLDAVVVLRVLSWALRQARGFPRSPPRQSEKGVRNTILVLRFLHDFESRGLR